MNSKCCGTVPRISRPACLKAAATFLAAGTRTPLYFPLCQLPSGSFPTHTQATISGNGLIAATDGWGVSVAQARQRVVVASDRQRQFLGLRRLHKGEVAALVGECLGGRHRQAGDLICRKSWIDGYLLKVVAEIDTHCRGELDHLWLLLSELARSGARRVVRQPAVR